MSSFREETDSLGKVQVPSQAYYGASTKRALEHFPIGRDLTPPELIRAYALLKKACALVNRKLKLLEEKKADLIIRAIDEILEGKLHDNFPLSIWQTGSGTQTNMNFNEVIANRAIELSGGKMGSKDPIHPNDHVNMSQSSNDTFPSAMHIAAGFLSKEMLSALKVLEKALYEKEKRFMKLVKIGRTHLQDATPITLGQEFSGYRSLIERAEKRIEFALDGLYDLAIGGTAVGTGLNAPKDFGEKVVEELKKLTAFPFRSHPNKFAALSSHDEIVFASASFSTCAGSLMKIANDIRWLGSGPRCGLGELLLPQNEPGSSIMPGKVNPTQCEALTMAAAQVMGNHTTINFAGSQGNFELNVYKPVMIFDFLHSALILKDATLCFTKFCVEGIEVDEKKIDAYVQNSLMTITALVPKLGYDKCAEIAKLAYRENKSLLDATLKLGYLKKEEFLSIVDPKKMLNTK